MGNWKKRTWPKIESKRMAIYVKVNTIKEKIEDKKLKTKSKKKVKAKNLDFQ